MADQIKEKIKGKNKMELSNYDFQGAVLLK
jgi:hypothetical protein